MCKTGLYAQLSPIFAGICVKRPAPHSFLPPGQQDTPLLRAAGALWAILCPPWPIPICLPQSVAFQRSRREPIILSTALRANGHTQNSRRGIISVLGRHRASLPATRGDFGSSSGRTRPKMPPGALRPATRISGCPGKQFGRPGADLWRSSPNRRTGGWP